MADRVGDDGSSAVEEHVRDAEIEVADDVPRSLAAGSRFARARSKRFGDRDLWRETNGVLGQRLTDDCRRKSARGYSATALTSRSRNWLFHPEPRGQMHQPVIPTLVCSTSYSAPAPLVGGHRICSAEAGAPRNPSRRCLCARREQRKHHGHKERRDRSDRRRLPLQQPRRILGGRRARERSCSG